MVSTQELPDQYVFLRMEKTKGLKNLKLEHIPKPKIGKEIVATLEKVVRTKFQ